MLATDYRFLMIGGLRVVDRLAGGNPGHNCEPRRDEGLGDEVGRICQKKIWRDFSAVAKKGGFEARTWVDGDGG